MLVVLGRTASRGHKGDNRGGVVRKRGLFAFLALLVASLALIAAGCGGGSDDGGGDEAAATTEAADTGAAAGGGDEATTEEEGGGEAAGAVTALPSSSCGEVEYGGEGEPNVLIASDLPLQGASRTQTTQINDAIRLVLDEAGWKAGDLNVAFQACDDATAQAGKWDSGKCNQNAQAYAGNESMVGLIGTFNSGCAAIIIPVLNQAPGGGMAMVSPANTYVCLTEGGPGCAETEPDQYYPSGARNYTRTVANDAFQGAAVAEFAQEKGVTSLYILNDKEASRRTFAARQRRSASRSPASRPGIRRRRATRRCSTRSSSPGPTASSSVA
jgi:ABC-type branched-subunit amino acid transport system substrate-binding protein